MSEVELRTVANTMGGKYEVEVCGPLVHQCPFVKETDNGLITITYTPDRSLVELHSLAQYLEQWADVAIPHEEISVVIADDLAEALGDQTRITVVTEWETAGLRTAVTVRRP